MQWDTYYCILCVSLSLCYYRPILVLRTCSHCAVRFVHPIASLSPLCSRWVCVLHESESARYPVNVCSHRTSRFKQSCESLLSWKAETFNRKQPMELTRRRQKTKPGGFTTIVNTVDLSRGSESVMEYVVEVEVTLVSSIPQMKLLYFDSLFGDCIDTLWRGCCILHPTSCHRQ